MPLLIRPALAPDEGFRGYVCRLASLNLSPSLFRPMLSSMRTVAAAASEVANLSGESVEALRRRGCAVTTGRREFGGVCFGSVILPRKLVRLKSRAVCPECIAKDGVSRCVWELHGYDICDRHGLKLVDVCSACRQPLSWSISSGERCACGFSFAQLEVEAGRPSRRLLCEILASSMLRTIHGGPVSIDAGSASAAPIDWTLLLYEFVDEVLIPRFGEAQGLEYSERFRAARDELKACMLEDQVYRDYLRDFVFMYASADPLKLVSTLRPGRSQEWALCRNDDRWGELCYHRILWDFKRKVEERKRQVARRINANDSVRRLIREGARRTESAERASAGLTRVEAPPVKPFAPIGSP